MSEHGLLMVQDTAVRRQVQAEAAAQKAAEKPALQEAKQAAAELKRQQLAIEKVSKTSKKAQKQRKPQAQTVNSDAAAPEAEVVILGTSRTRTITSWFSPSLKRHVIVAANAQINISE